MERKFSAKRAEILELLKSTKFHPGAQWVYDQLKPRIADLSLATVYRNLRLFCEEKNAASLGVVRGEERFDGISAPHPHLVCTRCGVILDIPQGNTVSPHKQQHPSNEIFFIDHRKTIFYGLCSDCYKNDDSGGDPDAA